MANPQWKRTERHIAALLGGRRIPINGRGDQPDIQHPWLAIECKERKELPQWLTSAMQQAARTAAPRQLPVVVLHEHGRPYRDSLVVMTLGDFCDWFGDDDAGDDPADR